MSFLLLIVARTLPRLGLGLLTASIVYYSTGMYFVIVLPVQIVLGNLGDCSIGVLRSLEYCILWVSSLGSPSKIDPWKWNAGLKQVNKTINNGNALRFPL